MVNTNLVFFLILPFHVAMIGNFTVRNLEKMTPAHVIRNFVVIVGIMPIIMAPWGIGMGGSGGAEGGSDL
jgi:hypothetical protein